jgi:hypothetical protein
MPLTAQSSPEGVKDYHFEQNLHLQAEQHEHEAEGEVPLEMV